MRPCGVDIRSPTFRSVKQSFYSFHYYVEELTCLCFENGNRISGNADAPTSNRWCLLQKIHSAPTLENLKQGHEKHLLDVLHANFPQHFSKMELESHRFCVPKMII
jgi:hypothetical protein